MDKKTPEHIRLAVEEYFRSLAYEKIALPLSSKDPGFEEFLKNSHIAYAILKRYYSELESNTQLLTSVRHNLLVRPLRNGTRRGIPRFNIMTLKQSNVLRPLEKILENSEWYDIAGLEPYFVENISRVLEYNNAIVDITNRVCARAGSVHPKYSHPESGSHN